MVSASTTMFSGPMPYFAASSMILRAMRTRPSAVSGMPSSSSVSATTAPPYFLTSGNTASITARLPETELTKGLPLYRRMAASIAGMCAVSICSGTSVTDCTAYTASRSIAASSMPGRPTLTSSRSAPASTWVTASRSM